MSKFTEDPPTSPPKEGYQDSLQSVIYQPIVDAVINLMKASDDFSHVSTFFNSLVMSISDKQFPSVVVWTENRTTEAFAIRSSFRHTVLVKVSYFVKHHQKLVSEELYHFAEKFEELIFNNRRLDDSVQCVIKSTPANIVFDFAVEENFVIDAVIIDLNVEVIRSS